MKSGSQQGNKKASPLTESLAACRTMFKYALLFGCIVNLLMLATPIYSMQVLDRVISSQNTDTLLLLTLVIVGALVLLSLIQLARSFAMNQMGGWFEQTLSSKLFANSVKLSVVSKSGGSQQLRDLQKVKTFLTSPSLVSILDIPWALIFVIVMFMIHPWMGTMTVVGGVILVALAVITDKVTKPLHEASNEQFIVSMRQVDQAARNAEVVHVMGMTSTINENWQEYNNRLQNSQALVSNRQTTFMEITKFLRMVLQILVTGVGAYLVLKNEMSTGAIIACSSLSGRALAPFESAVNSLKQMVDARKSFQRIEESLDKYSEESEKMSLPTPEGRVAVENVYFAPVNSNKHILKAINFNLEAGDSLAIIGPSASGKTTLAKVVVGIYAPQIGTIRIDNASMQDWKREELGQHVGYLPQEVELFSGTIKENIARMRKDAKDEDILMAAKLAGVHDLVLQMPKGYETEIGPDGAMLSGGQRQRIGLARAFFGEPKLIVLDEPNANLDSFGELALSQALARAKERKITTIIISHRTSILSVADKILAIKDGTIALFGDRDEVLEKMNQASRAAASGPVAVDLAKRKEAMN
jgi:PrtD family type I secretion system ABC transporter